MKRGYATFHNAVLRRRDEAREALLEYAESRSLRVTGWHNSGDRQYMRVGQVEFRTYSCVVVVRCEGGRYFSTRFCVSASRDELVEVGQGCESYAVREVDARRLPTYEFVAHEEDLDELLLLS